MKHDKDGVCGKCKGKGYIKHEVVQNGVCFWCMGHKSVNAFKEWSEKESNKAKLRDIENAKETIKFCLDKIESYKGTRHEGSMFEHSKRNMMAQEIARIEGYGIKYQGGHGDGK
jgi:hypothetical protein